MVFVSPAGSVAWMLTLGKPKPGHSNVLTRMASSPSAVSVPAGKSTSNTVPFTVDSTVESPVRGSVVTVPLPFGKSTGVPSML